MSSFHTRFRRAWWTPALLGLAAQGLLFHGSLIAQFAGIYDISPAAGEIVGGSNLKLYLTVEYPPDDVAFPMFITVSTDNPLAVPIAPTDFLVYYWAEVEVPIRPMKERQAVQLTASDGSRERYAWVTVLPAAVISLDLSAAAAPGDTVLTGTVTLNGPASGAGSQVELESSDPGAVLIPPRVSVPPGETQVSFPITTRPVSQSAPVEITARGVEGSARATLVVEATGLRTLELDPIEIIGSDVGEGAITLDAAAPAGGLAVLLASSDPAAASVDASVEIPAGAASAAFRIRTSPVSATRDIVITGTLSGVEKTAVCRVLPPHLAGIAVSPPGLIGGRLAVASVHLIGKAPPGGVRVSLASAEPALVNAPAEVTVLAVASSASFPLPTGRVVARTEVKLTAAHEGIVEEALLQVIPARSGDWDGDGDRDLKDLAALQICFSGPFGSPRFRRPSELCLGVFDFDADGDIDSEDFLAFQGVESGPPDGPPAPAVEMDATLVPAIVELPDENGGSPRRAAALADDAGRQSEFVENEILLTTSDPAALQSFLSRWGGAVLETFDPTEYGVPLEKQHRVRIRTDLADASKLSEDLKALNPDRTFNYRVSSESGLGLLAAVAHEAARGNIVSLNWVYRPSTIQSGVTTEGNNANSFNWSYLSRQGMQRTGVSEAWRLLDRSGKLGNRVKIAVLDTGFAASSDYPPGSMHISGVGDRSSDSVRPWHGTQVSQTVAGAVDNSFGVAGVAGPAASLITYRVPDTLSLKIGLLKTAISEGARIINMSFGATLFFPGGPSQSENDVTLAVHNVGVLLFAAAGNDNHDVDEVACQEWPVCPFESCPPLYCYEPTWIAPCENHGVICVGALDWESTNRASYSNWGGTQVTLFAPGEVWVGPNPDDSSIQRRSGTSFASPFAAGVAALIWAANPDLSADEVARTLFSTVHTSPDGRVRWYVNALGAVEKALGRAAPAVNIVSPRDGGTYPDMLFGSDILFHVEGTNPDGDLKSIQWTSGIQGVLGTGAQLVRNDLMAGYHTITVRADYPNGFFLESSVAIQVVAFPLQVQIIQPAVDPTQVFAGQPFLLKAWSFDRNRGGSELPDTSLHWTSNLQGPGELGTGRTLQITLTSVGEHRVTVSAIAGGQVAQDSITVNVDPPPPDLPPSAAILDPPRDTNFQTDIRTDFPQTDDQGWYRDLALQGWAQDREDSLDRLQFVWTRENLYNPAAGAEVIANTLSTSYKMYARLANHRFTLAVTDRAGNTTRVSRTIRVDLPPH